MAELLYALRGDVDAANSTELFASLKRAISAGGDDLLVDCTHLRRIDSSGVRVLLRTYERLEYEGRNMLLANLSRQSRMGFDALGLSEMYRYESIRIAR